jgi:hypothetical protein
MISISGTVPRDQAPKSGGDSFYLMTSLLRAREAADACNSLAKQAEDGPFPFLAKFWGEIAELQTDILRRTTAAVERLEEESREFEEESSEGASDEHDPITDELKTKRQTGTGPKDEA